jgi:UDP-N-acetylmuramate dehydrogenase
VARRSGRRKSETCSRPNGPDTGSQCGTGQACEAALIATAMTSLVSRLPSVRGRIAENEPVAPFTWFRVGGPANVLFLPADSDDLAHFLAELDSEIPVTVLGIGSNIIVRDGGLDGVVVRLGGRAFGEISVDASAQTITVGAGVPDAVVAREAAKAGIGGLEFLAGIPGSIGGALTMNAGCYGRETKDVLERATGISRSSGKVVLENADFGFTYRHSAASPGIIWTSATFKGHADDQDTVKARIAEITARREASQPIREKTGGSTFKNPDPDMSGGLSAWQCVDAAGMRGARRGGAQVSEKHANFLINTGDATAADIEGLGEDVRAAVFEKLGVTLEWEIRRIGKA